MLTLINLPLINCFIQARDIYLQAPVNEDFCFRKVYNLTIAIRELLNL